MTKRLNIVDPKEDSQNRLRWPKEYSQNQLRWPKEDSQNQLRWPKESKEAVAALYITKSVLTTAL
jgi:hypothetical protein